MSNESCLLDLLAAARNGNGSLQRKTIGKCARQHKRGILRAVGHCEEFDPVLVHRAKMQEKDFIAKMGDPLLRRKGAVSCAPDGSQSTRVPTTLHSCEPGGVAQEFRGR